MGRTGRSNQHVPIEPLQLEEEISRVAHSYWEEEGRPEGEELRHWHKAEAELFKARGLKLPDEPW